MAGGGKSTGNAARTRKRVEATVVLKRSRDGSAFTRCEACNKDVPVVLIDMHSCSLDSKIRMTLEAQVVEKTVELTKADRKKSSKGSNKDPKRKRPPTAFFLFMKDFRKDFKAAHPDIKGVTIVGKEGGERWNAMTDEEKKPYIEKAAELKAQAENGEGSGENNVTQKAKVPAPVARDNEREQEVDQPVKKRRYEALDEDDDDDDADDQEDEDGDDDEDNELDDDM